MRDHALSACPIGERKNDHRLKASSLPTLIEMVSADLGFTLLPEIALHTNMIKANPDLRINLINAAPSRTLALVTVRAHRYKASSMCYYKFCKNYCPRCSLIKL